MFPVIFIAPVIQLFILGYAATTDVKNVPIVVVDADRSAGEPRSRSRASTARRTSRVVGVTTDRRRHRARDSRRGDAWMALAIPPDYGEMVAARPARDRAGGRRRHRLELDHRRAGLRVDAHRGDGRPSWPPPRRPPGAPRLGAHRRAHPRLVQPAAREPHFMVPGVAGAAADGHHDRARRRWRSCARRNWARSSSSTSRRSTRWELIVGKLLPFGLIGMIDVILVVSRGGALVRDAAAGQLPAAVRPVARLPAVHARPGPVRLDDLATTSSRR